MEKSVEIPEIDIYTDGGAEPNPGKGGFGVILSWRGHEKQISQGYTMTTNNRMELMGVIVGLEAVKKKANINLYTDSKYVVESIEYGWVKKWKENNWYRNKKEKAINIDLWERLLELLAKHNVKFYWIKGHNGHLQNEKCDTLASQAIKSKDMIEDVGYEEQQQIIRDNINSTKRISEEGDLCRECNVPVIKKTAKNKKIRPEQTYYFEYYMYCPQCKKMYMVEAAKKFVNKSDTPNLF